jgi:hypothetical protein
VGEFRTVAVSLVLALSAVVWLVVVPLLFVRGAFQAASWGGASGDLAGAGVSYTWATWLGAGMPLAGVVVSATTRRRGWSWFFGICLVVVAVVTMLKLASDARHAPPPSPSPWPRHCVERSGGGNECPGD